MSAQQPPNEKAMTFQKLHCALTAAACAGIVICAAALSHAAEFKVQKLKAPQFKVHEFKAPEFKMNEFKMGKFKMQPYKVSADLSLNDLDYFGLGLGLDGKKISAAKKNSGSGRKISKKSKSAAGVKK